ncbi:MAG: ABC transporter permease subunit [Bacilli bacterium]|nr:ABC transporter permease subunit [Bacilli bacterium]
MMMFKKNLPFHLMLLPGVILVIIFCYIPMYGIVIAFQNFVPAKGLFGDQQWVGLENFRIVFSFPNIWQVIKNTVVISLWKIALNTLIPVIIALLLNEINNKYFKKSVQTIIYFPYFLSWVIFGGILIDVLSPSSGIVNEIIRALGFKEIYFLGNEKWFQPTAVITDIFKTFGFSTVVYLATIAGISPTLYEAAQIDGANRWQQTWHITLPGMKVIIILLLVLSMGNILNAGFDQIWNIMNVNVISKADILDTYIYRQGMISRLYGQAAAVGLIKSIVSTIFIGTSYWIAYKFLDYKLF